MYRPKHPCRDCRKRGLDACLECAEWKAYKEKLLEYYESERRRKSVDRAAKDTRDRLLRQKQKKQGYTNFHYK